jgi:hypothetical protein
MAAMVLAVAYATWTAPSESFYFTWRPAESTREAISTGSLFAEHVFLGYTIGLQGLVTDAYAAVLDTATPERCHDSIPVLDLSIMKMPIDVKIALVQREEIEMQLLAFETRGNLYIMTFSPVLAKSGPVRIPGHRPPVLTVGVCYYWNPNDGLLRRFMRKVANLPLVRLGARRYGTSGRFAVFGSSHTYDLSDICGWARAEGEAYFTNQCEIDRRNSEDTGRLRIWRDSIERRVERDVEFRDLWADSAISAQMERCSSSLGSL